MVFFFTGGKKGQSRGKNRVCHKKALFSLEKDHRDYSKTFGQTIGEGF